MCYVPGLPCLLLLRCVTTYLLSLLLPGLPGLCIYLLCLFIYQTWKSSGSWTGQHITVSVLKDLLVFTTKVQVNKEINPIQPGERLPCLDHHQVSDGKPEERSIDYQQKWRYNAHNLPFVCQSFPLNSPPLRLILAILSQTEAAFCWTMARQLFGNIIN